MSLLSYRPQAALVLADGTVFSGTAVGYIGNVRGELVFNTALSGYQEILTDPSYCGQIVTMTYPHIGNVGCNQEDCESHNMFASGLVIRDMPNLPSSWRQQQSLPDYLRDNKIVAIADIDTRALTRHLATNGSQSACIVCQSSENKSKIDLAWALQNAQSFPGLLGMDLAQQVSCKEPYTWQQGSWSLKNGFANPPKAAAKFRVVAYDFGVKLNILRLLVDNACEVIVVPAKTTAEDVLSYRPDGVFLSNGPGDPEPCDYAIKAIAKLLEQQIPIFGICLGHQLLALASGAKTVKMKFGHHGANHPVKDLSSGRVFISSQNHGFAVDHNNLPANLQVTHISLFDQSIQGIKRLDAPAFSFQGHPEASPGPQELAVLFQDFVELMSINKQR